MHSATPAEAGKIERDHRQSAVKGGLQINVIKVLYDA